MWQVAHGCCYEGPHDGGKFFKKLKNAITYCEKMVKEDNDVHREIFDKEKKKILDKEWKEGERIPDFPSVHYHEWIKKDKDVADKWDCECLWRQLFGSKYFPEVYDYNDIVLKEIKEQSNGLVSCKTENGNSIVLNYTAYQKCRNWDSESEHDYLYIRKVKTED